MFQTLVTQVKESFIQEKDVVRILAQEDWLYPSASGLMEDGIDLNQPLEAITRAVVKRWLRTRGEASKKRLIYYKSAEQRFGVF